MSADFQKPSLLARSFNNLLGFLAARGLGPGYCYELSTRGRKSGRIFKTPVNLMKYQGKLWLVAPRGHTQWTKNAEAAGSVTLKRGQATTYRIRKTELSERPPLLKLYLQTWSGQVQRYFKVRAEAPVSEFERVAADHPVYELILGPT
jgi:deazaflavin-dependent oxidoreductase (nitroreductase family)